MTEKTTSVCENGVLKVGDLVLSSPREDYGCLVGRVLAIEKTGTAEHNTGNEGDDIHVNFTEANYSRNRTRELDAMFGKLYRSSFMLLPLDDIIMAPDALIRITDISRAQLSEILDSEQRAAAFYEQTVAEFEQSRPDTQTETLIISEKLYSPLFVNIVADDNEYYDGEYWCDPISQMEAAGYEDEIRAALMRERMRDEEPRGLMTYYHDKDSVDEKVRSLWVDVEVHKDRLWGVASIEMTAPLTAEELGLLKDYLTGQYSDGFGEGFEQREIKVGDGELYVSLWDSGDKFFIDTQRELERRLGIKLPSSGLLEAVPETPAQAALHEPDTYDSEEVAALREQLIGRLNANLTEYVHSLHDFCEEEIIGTSSEIAAMAGAHYYLTEIHNFHTSELEYLLKFQNPLQVVADQFELEAEIENHSAVIRDIFDSQSALHGDYALADAGTNALSPAANVAAHGQDAGENPSVLERIHRAREDAKANPAPQREARGNDRTGEPEL